jgi:probable addiction module antidote protein
VLNDALETGDFQLVLAALKTAMRAQNVTALAKASNMRRDRLYKTFSGEVDPAFSRVLQLLAGLNVQLVAKPRPKRPELPRPKRGRPPKK